VEEVEPEDLAGGRGRRGQGRDVARRGVGRQDRVGRADPVELRKGLVLELLVLRHGLDDEVAPLEVLESRRAADARERGVLRGGVELALRREPLEDLAEPAEAPLDQLGARLDEEDGEPRLGRDLDDACAHETTADNADVLDGHERLPEPAEASCARDDPAGTAARSGPSPAGTDSAR